VCVQEQHRRRRIDLGDMMQHTTDSAAKDEMMAIFRGDALPASRSKSWAFKASLCSRSKEYVSRATPRGWTVRFSGGTVTAIPSI
jgi:hypothetical protein